MSIVNTNLFTAPQLQNSLAQLLHLSGASSEILPFWPATWEQLQQVFRFLEEEPKFGLRKVFIAPGTLEANLRNNDPCPFFLLAKIGGADYMALLRYNTVEEYFEIMLHDGVKGEVFKGNMAANIMSKAAWASYDAGKEVFAAVPAFAVVPKKLVDWELSLKPRTEAPASVQPEALFKSKEAPAEQRTAPPIANAPAPTPAPRPMAETATPPPSALPQKNASQEAEKQRIKEEALERKRKMQEEQALMEQEAQKALEKAENQRKNKKIAIFALLLLTLASATFLFFKGLPMPAKPEYQKIPHILQGKVNNSTVRLSIDQMSPAVAGKVKFKYSHQVASGDWKNLDGYFDLEKQEAFFEKIGEGSIEVDRLTGRWSIEGKEMELYSLPE